MAGPYTIIKVTDVTIGGTDSLLQAERGRTLPEPSRVKIYANRESADILYNITVGADSVLQDGGAAINATAGDIPIIPDNEIVDTFGNAGDEIVIRAANSNVALQEARVIIKVTPVDDDVLQRAMNGV